MVIVLKTVLFEEIPVIPVRPDPSPTKDVADMVPVDDIDPEVIVPVKVGFALLAFNAISLMLVVIEAVLAVIAPWLVVIELVFTSIPFWFVVILAVFVLIEAVLVAISLILEVMEEVLVVIAPWLVVIELVFTSIPFWFVLILHSL